MNAAPTIASDFRTIRVLGRGGMGVVYEAEQVSLGRRVALKVLSDETSADPVALARLRREALAMGSLQHPHIVQVSGFHEGPPPFLVMELLAGQSLRERLAQRGPMPSSDACLVALQLLAALGEAHRAGIIHRDVKPANVFVVQTPLTDVFVKLLDFGVAKLLTPQAGPALTRFDAVVGSAPYMAPEQIRGDVIDGRTDIFALGVTLYEMLAGRRPFVAAPNESVMSSILRGGPIAPLVGVPRELEAAVLRALAVFPSGRYATADEMSAALMPFIGRAQLGVLATSATAMRAPLDRTEVETRQVESATRGGPLTVAPTLAHTMAHTVDQTRGDVPYAGPRAPSLSSPSPSPSPSRPPWTAVLIGAAIVLVLLGVVAGLLAPRASAALEEATRGPAPAPTPMPTVDPATMLPVGSCRTSGFCIEYPPFLITINQKKKKDLPAECRADRGTWRDGPCDRTGTVGGCLFNGGMGTWSFPPTTPARAAECPDSAVFVRR
jgi:serine/threonine protein kinase